MPKDFLSTQDLSVSDIKKIFALTKQFKKKPFGNQLKRKTVLMLFAKPSTRTRVSFEVGINQLGGDDIFLQMKELQFSRGETIEDTARVLNRYGDGIVARLFKHENLLKIAQYTDGPTINGLTDLLHPCQAVCDLFTIQEKLGSLKGKTLAFLGDGNNNVTHSLLLLCSKLGVDIRVGCPKQYSPNKQILSGSQQNAEKSGSVIEIVTEPRKAVKNADVVYTDTWVSMGEEKSARFRERRFKPYQLNKKLLSLANKRALVMHDLPAHRGYEITSEVMDGKQSVIFDQAENRMHTEKAILVWCFS